MQKITPFLWFDGNAEEAARFYVSVFRDAKIKGIMHYTEAGPKPKGSVLTVTLELFGQEYVALNGGSEYAFTPAVSFMVIGLRARSPVYDLSSAGPDGRAGTADDITNWQPVNH